MNPSAAPPVSLLAAARSVWIHRQLIVELTRREVVGRYRGSMIGLAWSFFNPLLMLAVYTFVFGVVFGVRWGAAPPQSKAEFAVILFVGLIVHGLFAECVNRAPALILGNASFVKKVVFPLEVLAVVSLSSALFHFGVSLTVVLLAMLLTGIPLPPTAVLLPVVIAPLAIATLGLSWILASLGVFLRDVSQTIGIVTSALLFLAPVFYSVSAVPEPYRSLVLLNPLSFPIEQARDVLVWGRVPDWAFLGGYAFAALVVAAVGFWWFQKTRRGFADVV